MPTILADTFHTSLARLSGQEQKQAKLTAFDLQSDSSAPGLKFHRIDKSKDSNFWSVRVSRDLRIVVHKVADSVLLAYVGHHDDAYGWAERRRIERHPRTGVIQIVEVRELVEEIAAPARQLNLGFEVEPIAAAPAQDEGKARAPLFAMLEHEQLLSVGVPEDWLADVLSADEDGFLGLSEHLPPEASEALLEFATSGILKVPEPQPAAADPYAHPDAQRRFRVIENQEALEAALEFPWEKWAVFLHPAQRSVVERDFSGPARVAGSAGTGKTVVALHRVVRILRQDRDARMLLTTFSEPLANALSRKLKVLAADDLGLLERVTVASFRAIAEELYMLAFGRKAHLASRDLIRSLVLKAAEAEGVTGFSEQFLLSEWRHVADAWQVEDAAAYAEVPRMGRRLRLGAKQRAAVWPVFERVRRTLKERGYLTRATMFTAVTGHYAEQEHKPFSHIVVDEAQDLGVPELRFLAALAPEAPNALFFAGDLGQRIFQPPFSWKGLGIDVRGRSSTLKVNYRTSHQIRAAADRLLPKSVRDVDGLEDERAGTVSVFNGPPPQVVIVSGEAEEQEAVARFITSMTAERVEASEIALFVRTRDELPRARAAAAKAGVGATELTGRNEGEAGRISIGTMHFAKGLEFKAVAVMGCDEEILPSAARLAEVSDEMELDDVYATERQLFYVAATRARDWLLVTGVAPASEFLEDL